MSAEAAEESKASTADASAIDLMFILASFNMITSAVFVINSIAALTLLRLGLRIEARTVDNRGRKANEKDRPKAIPIKSIKLVCRTRKSSCEPP